MFLKQKNLSGKKIENYEEFITLNTNNYKVLCLVVYSLIHKILKTNSFLKIKPVI